MKIRDITANDTEAINSIHTKSGFDYPFPDIEKPLFIVKRAIEDDEGNVIGYGVIKLQGEAYLWLDQKFSPKEKIMAMEELNEDIALKSWQKGLDQISAWIPPEIEEKFGKRMKKMNWIKSKWSNWSNNLVN